MAQRHTKQKEVIMEFLKRNSNKHLSIDEIQEGIGRNASTVTIYRMINKLVSENLITKRPLENKQGFCYQFNEVCSKCNKVHSHYHLICSKCNNIIHYNNPKIDKICEVIINDTGFNVDMGQTSFYGICKECMCNAT